MNELNQNNPFIGALPQDTYCNCAQVLSFVQYALMDTESRESMNDQEDMGLYWILEGVQLSLRNEGRWHEVREVC